MASRRSTASQEDGAAFTPRRSSDSRRARHSRHDRSSTASSTASTHYHYREDDGRGKGKKKNTLVEKIVPPNPLPMAADPQQRAARKKIEKETGGFSWEHAAELTLLGLFTAFSVDKSLQKLDKTSKEKDSHTDKPTGRGQGRRERRNSYRDAGRGAHESRGYGYDDDRFRRGDGADRDLGRRGWHPRGKGGPARSSHGDGGGRRFVSNETM